MYYIFMLLLLPEPFQGMEPWQKTMEPQRPDNSPGPGPGPKAIQ